MKCAMSLRCFPQASQFFVKYVELKILGDLYDPRTCRRLTTHHKIPGARNFHHGPALVYNRNCNSMLTDCKLPLLQIERAKTSGWKSKDKDLDASEEAEIDDEDDDFEDIQYEKGAAPMKIIQINSTRIDLLLKTGLGIARNVIEQSFYKGLIRVNGQKIMKKSYTAKVGDDVDLIKGPSEENPNFLTVSRIEVLDMRPTQNTLRVKIRKHKSLLIENYQDAWKPSSDEDDTEAENVEKNPT